MTGFTPHVYFPGTAREAFTFYQELFGGTLRLWTYGEFDMSGMVDPGTDLPDDGIANAELLGGAIDLTGGDDSSADPRPLEGLPFQFVLTPDTLGEAERLVGRIAGTGGTVVRELAPAPWGDHYGEVRDRFGITWAFNVPPGPA